MLSNAGFKNINIEPVKKVVEYKDLEDYIKGFMTGTPLSAFLQKKDASVREALSQRLREASQQEFGDSLTLEMLAYMYAHHRKIDVTRRHSSHSYTNETNTPI